MSEVACHRTIQRRIALEFADVALRFGSVRQWLLKRGDRSLYDFYCVKRFEGLPLPVQELRYRVIVNLLRSIERAFADGRVGPSVRKRVLDVLVGEMVANARKNVAPFIQRHGVEPPAFLLISPTQRCNLCCKGCYAASSAATPATLSFSTVRRILQDKRDNWGSHFTVLSGGEPLLYKSEGKSLYDVFREFQDNYFLMFTNGTLIDERVAARLAELGNVTAAISVEGFETETDKRRGVGVFRKTEHAMHVLRKAGVPFGISLTATKENADTLMQERIIEHYFDDLGAIYAWIFHYMPIGRSVDTELMVTPDQRKRMLERQLELLNDRGLFFIDFWNGGPLSGGCVSGGRPGGYLYIDWNGDIQPCVFVPYAVDNINDVYKSGRTLSSVLDNPVFVGWKAWQKEYRGHDGLGLPQNLFTPCPMRDHYDVAHNLLTRHKAKPTNRDAADAIQSEEYRNRMLEYGRDLSLLLDPMWEMAMHETSTPSAASKPSVASRPAFRKNAAE
jgi:MoaA/NifB/PqqE/SkfB family radical SAM enzyme